jgi:hypothetical protein
MKDTVHAHLDKAAKHLNLTDAAFVLAIKRLV